MSQESLALAASECVRAIERLEATKKELALTLKLHDTLVELRELYKDHSTLQLEYLEWVRKYTELGEKYIALMESTINGK